jgi:hypothetical protein
MEDKQALNKICDQIVERQKQEMNRSLINNAKSIIFGKEAKSNVTLNIEPS